MSKGRHRKTKPSPNKHRRTTLGDHFKRLTVIAAAALAVIAGLYAVPTPADAKPSYAQTMSEQDAAVDYGSGFPGGPIGAQVLSTKDYTAISDWMIFGDSITKGGYKELLPLTPGKRLAVDAWAGRNTAQTADSLEKLLAAGYVLPKKVVWATGANDIFNPLVMPDQVKRVLDMIAAASLDTEVFWVDVQAARPGYAGDQRNSMMVNKAIWQGCTQARNCTVISWAGFLASKPGRIPMYIDAKGVHPNAAGYKAWALLIATAVQP